MYRICIIKDSVVENVAIYQEIPESPPPGYDSSYIAVPSDTAGPGWGWDGSQFNAPDADPVPPMEREPVAILFAQARLIIDGEDISGIETAAGFAGAMRIDTGVFWFFFTTPQPDTDYGVLPQARNGGGLFADVSAQETDYIEITVTDRLGAPAEPSQLFVSVQRTV